MKEFIDFLHLLGSSSLSGFWLPVLLWTVIGTLALLVAQFFTRIHPVYQYHSRIALLTALPAGLLASGLNNPVLFGSEPAGPLTSRFIVIQSPLTVSATPAAEPAYWAEPMVWLGGLMIILSVLAVMYLIKLTLDYFALRRFMNSLEMQPVRNCPLVSKSNVELIQQQSLAADLALSQTTEVPFTFGSKKSIIVLPASLSRNPGKFNMALRHELMHIKHRDYLLNGVLMGIKALFWFHPLVHHLYKECKEYREISCDSEVLVDPEISKREYAELLFELAPKNVFQNNRAVSMAVHSSNLKKRIKIMSTQPFSKTTLRSSFILTLISACLVAGIMACSDLQDEGVTNKDVAEAQNQLQTSDAGEIPLYFINGEKMDMAESKDVISRIKPKYIKSIDVLKGERAMKKYGDEGKNGVVDITLLNKEKALTDLLPASEVGSGLASKPEDEFYVVVEQMPELIGGFEGIMQDLKYPEEAKKAGVQGRVIVKFIVNEQGDVENPQIIRGIGAGADKEALRVVRQAEFRPGKQRGKAVPVQYSLPIIFKLNGKKKSDKSGSASLNNGINSQIHIAILENDLVNLEGSIIPVSSLKNRLHLLEFDSDTEFLLSMDKDSHMGNIRSIERIIRKTGTNKITYSAVTI